MNFKIEIKFIRSHPVDVLLFFYFQNSDKIPQLRYRKCFPLQKCFFKNKLSYKKFR